MTVLSAQTIRRCCEQKNMIFPFVERAVQGGMSYGLSSCGYDVRINESFQLDPGGFKLASTIERFVIPKDIVGRVCDKSTLARRGIAVQNTIIEPGWYGYLTLELTNNGPEPVQFYAGTPIAQIMFERLDEATEQPYVGKYQNQQAGPVEAKYE